MRRFFLLIPLCAGLLFGGCGTSKPFVKAVDEYTKVILPEYKTYVAQDTTLSEDTKRIRTQTADKFQALVDEAKK